jgi:cation:H+ antiporter
MESGMFIWFGVGLACLIAGAEALVRGASRLATIIGISPLVIGLTVVAYGTSAPEAAVSVYSAFQGQADLALGNVVGSNIFNMLFILGLSALIVPLVVAQQLVRLDVPIMLGVSLLLFVLALDGTIGRMEGLGFVTGVLAYTGFIIHQSRRQSVEAQAVNTTEVGDGKGRWDRPVPVAIALTVAGLLLLVIGARWLVAGAVAIATMLGVSELIIGLTIMAVATSLPEVATSVVASLRGERDLAVGNVVGSSIFNILLVVGLAGLVAPAGIRVSPAVLRFDIPVMLAVALACLPIFATGHVIARWEGGLFFGYYVAYMCYVILDATEHDAMPTFSTIMLAFIIPLTAITLLVIVVRTMRARCGPPEAP